jgi:16S rRNA (guanine(966)-N(2))-methyltransferase RsmD
MAKEALFTILENHFDLEEVAVLDLFSGTGSISYEFASRGTRRIMLVEINNRHIRFIRDTLRELDMTEVEVVRSNAFTFLRHAPGSFDIIFADPPYDLPDIEKLPDLVFEKELLNPGGWLVLEHSRKQDFQGHPQFLFLKKYGQVHFSFFEKPE